MNLPHRFDANEWFILIASVFVYTIVLFLPKRFLASQTVFIWVFNLFLAILVDYIIGTAPLDLYDNNDGPDYELFDLLIYPLLYSPTVYLITYFFDSWKPQGVYAVLYVAGWALLTTGLEWLAHLFHVYTYSGWQLIYSIPTYALFYIANLILFRILRSFYSADSRNV